jgi:hypothetical protein
MCKMLSRLVPLPIMLLLLMPCDLSRRFALPAQTEPPACPAHKISFAQEEGCVNDGSIEFCLPADDLNALAAVREIAPQTTCMRAGGRARCDLEAQVLCLVDTKGMCRRDTPGAMTDAGWQTVCDLAALPFIERIVPTWYE